MIVTLFMTEMFKVSAKSSVQIKHVDMNCDKVYL